jgi:NADH:ubiquinone oxidoreductase subunit D
VNITTILDLIAEREATAGQAADRLRQQITTLTAELARIDSELAALATTRTTLQALTTAEFTADDPTIASAPYQQILTVLDAASTGMRAKDICIAVGVEPSPKHVEGTRARLKRLVNRQILTETEPGVFTLTPKRT